MRRRALSKRAQRIVRSSSRSRVRGRLCCSRATPSEEPTAQRLASDASTLAASPLPCRRSGEPLHSGDGRFVTVRAWSPEVSALEVLRRTAVEDIAAGNRFGFEAGRRGLYLRLHVADFLADEEGQLILEDAVVLDRNRLSETSAVLVRAQGRGRSATQRSIEIGASRPSSRRRQGASCGVSRAVYAGRKTPSSTAGSSRASIG